RAVRLVGLELLGADRPSAEVESDADQLGALLAQQLAQHVDEAEDRVRRLAARVREVANRVVSSEDVRVAVDQEQARAGSGRRGQHGPILRGLPGTALASQRLAFRWTTRPCR